MKLEGDLPKDRILLVAAEASSCMYAKKFMKSWLQLYPNTEFFGVGDREMESLGMRCLGYAEDMAVMGLQEVLSHWSVIKKCFLDIEQSAKEDPPKFAILLDYPGFNLRMAKRLKSLGISVVYYISPQLWAWKKGRVEQVRRYVDHMMVVFPFEVDFYKEHGIEAHYIGHPLVEVIESEGGWEPTDPSQQSQVTLGLMPGSRRSEVRYNFLTQLECAQELSREHDLRVKVLVAPTLDSDELRVQVPSGIHVEFVQAPPTQMISSCDLMLTASGTATLQVALLGKPMVVMYKMNPFTAFFAKRLVHRVPYFCIVNLILKEEVVPEFFQEKASMQKLVETLKDLISDPQQSQRQIEAFKRLRKQLGQGGATHNLVSFLRKHYGMV